MSKDTKLEAEIKDWYAKLPEHTLPNFESVDGTFLEINLNELVSFITTKCQEAQIDIIQDLYIEISDHPGRYHKSLILQLLNDKEIQLRKASK